MRKQEILRQLMHVLFGLLLVLLILNNVINAWILFYALLAGIALSFLSIKFSIPVVSWFLKNFDRPKAKLATKLPGEGFIFFLVGSLLALKLFSQDIALASILILSFGDGISHLVGEGIGKNKIAFNKSKNIEGLIFGVIAGTLAALFFVSFPEALVASLAAMLVEAVEIKIRDSHVDDNLFVPLVAGTAVLLMRIIGI
ncbi:MAG TPA: hypothetical protein VJA86_03315 [Candidatus Nanoarchaeia archaeon]|nr:hypothetical protein [Candidatus Nanoarchaeia archaeon]